MKAIYFDMDGTLADMFNYPDWLRIVLLRKPLRHPRGKRIRTIDEIREYSCKATQSILRHSFMFQGIVYRPTAECGPGRIRIYYEGIVYLIPFFCWACYHCFSNRLRGAKHEWKELGTHWADSVRHDVSDDNSMYHREGLHFVAPFFIYLSIDFSARFSYNKNDIQKIVKELCTKRYLRNSSWLYWGMRV